MRANMRCTLVAWLSPGTTSAGQLKGNRPVSSTYSVTPHDLHAIGFRVQGMLRTSASCNGGMHAVGKLEERASPHGSLQDGRSHPVAGPAAQSGRMPGAPAHQVSARVPSYLPLNSSSGAMYCSSSRIDTSASCALLMHAVIRSKHNENPRHAARGMSSAGVPHLRGAAGGLAGGLPEGVFGEAEVRHLQL